ncbi:hypothetical protein JOC77_003450 [Peribacillus deserti]|uniref:HNH endonuclease n=1 Tax=Peribacillus deserti TaxID=673318 RepID=A0ABS2QLG5_9BACI|nr:HNH endonuclease [Peribacillus deserti]MBM7694006.1 hypothetical protein [Peribacillus deserti]
MAKRKQTGICELCGREEVETTIHHLTPREMGGSFLPTAHLCIPCHKQIHALYSNAELALGLSSISLLKQDVQIQKFLKWIRKQAPGKYPKISKSRQKRR